MQSQVHWDTIYRNKPANTLSWFQQRAEPSLSLIRALGLSTDACIVDIGGGASCLIDDLLACHFTGVTVLDISFAALACSRHRLGPNANKASWVEADILHCPLAANSIDLWHDRAVFHFLLQADERKTYIDHASNSIKTGGFLIISTFAHNGPRQCSGLPVMQYSADSLAALFAPPFHCLSAHTGDHITPAGNTQAFITLVLQKT